MSLGENIYKLRTGKKLSQEDFAAAMEVSRQSVSKWENNMAVPELEKLIKMATLFEVSLDELVGNAPPHSKPEPKSEPIPTPAPGINIGDLISLFLLICSVIVPFLLMLSQSLIFVITGLKILPPVSTILSAHFSKKNKMVFRSYLIYYIIYTFVLLFVLNSDGFWLSLVNWGLIIFWYKRMK